MRVARPAIHLLIQAKSLLPIAGCGMSAPEAPPTLWPHSWPPTASLRPVRRKLMAGLRAVDRPNFKRSPLLPVDLAVIQSHPRCNCRMGLKIWEPFLSPYNSANFQLHFRRTLTRSALQPCPQVGLPLPVGPRRAGSPRVMLMTPPRTRPFRWTHPESG